MRRVNKNFLFWYIHIAVDVKEDTLSASLLWNLKSINDQISKRIQSYLKGIRKQSLLIREFQFFHIIKSSISFTLN